MGSKILKDLEIKEVARLYWLLFEEQETGKSAESLLDSYQVHAKYQLYYPELGNAEAINNQHKSILKGCTCIDLEQTLRVKIEDSNPNKDLPEFSFLYDNRGDSVDVVIIGVLSFPDLGLKIVDKYKHITMLVFDEYMISILKILFRKYQDIQFQCIDKIKEDTFKNKKILMLETRIRHLPLEHSRQLKNVLPKEEESRLRELLSLISKKPVYESFTFVTNKGILSRVDSRLGNRGISRMKLSSERGLVSLEYRNGFMGEPVIDYLGVNTECAIKGLSLSHLHELEVKVKQDVSQKFNEKKGNVITIGECFDVISNIFPKKSSSTEEILIKAKMFTTKTRFESCIVDSVEDEDDFFERKEVDRYVFEKMNPLQDGDILVPRFFLSKNSIRFFLIKGLPLDCYAPNSFTVIRPRKVISILPNFLFSILTSSILEELNQGILKGGSSSSSGKTSTLSIKEISALYIPNLMIDEQKRYLNEVKKADDVLKKAYVEREVLLDQAKKNIGIK